MIFVNNHKNIKMKYIYICSLVLATALSTHAQTPDLSFEIFQNGFSSPTTITNAGDDRLFIMEQDGVIKFIESENITTFLDIKDRVSSPSDNLGGYTDELGLLGLAFHPNFQTNGYFFINYTNNNKNTIISRFSIDQNDPNIADVSSEEIIMEIEQPYSNHNGGCIAFGLDGFLYIGMGDGGSGGDPQGYGQNMNSLLGKILRIDVSSLPYTIPPTNPFVEQLNHKPEIWASGIRNPWKFSFDKTTGDLWIGDVGQNSFEEIDFQSSDSPGGENYGWKCYEGYEPFDISNCNDQYTDPVHTYVNNGFPNDCSVTGGHVYRGSQYPNFVGHYIFGDYCSGKIFTLYDGGNANFDLTTQENTDIFISCFGEDANGELYIADRNSGIIYSIIDNSNSTSVGELEREELNIYPNPATKTEIINLSIGKDGDLVSISDLNGKIVSKQKIQNKQIYIQDLNYGVYFLEIDNKKTKLIIE